MIKISGLEHLTASEQPEVLGGLLDVSEGRLRRCSDYLKYSKTTSQSTRCLQDSATKSSEACQTRVSRTAHRHRVF